MYFDELRLGMKVDTAPAIIEKNKMMEFARDYDNIPLHTDEEYATSSHFGKLIAPGIMSFVSVRAKYLEVDFFSNENVHFHVWAHPSFAVSHLHANCLLWEAVLLSFSSVFLLEL